MTESDHITVVDSRDVCGGALAELERGRARGESMAQLLSVPNTVF